MTDNPDTPIVVSASPAGVQAATGTRDAMILLAALPALVAVLGTHDVSKIVAFVGSSVGLQVIGVLIAIGTPVWRQFHARWKHSDEVKMATSSDDKIAIVKGK